ncbi:hypothetical protein FHT91_005069 [Rhizobium sp. BK347]|jgi:hypothetical protein|nr:hypothetical protein [Rhizobium sp. BK252]MBB3405016.1 hypothetical protein [Rhizobium sp. BK289]MBB3417562.1 hypothetical protein [Rhizobium sp. BK284]MBB3485272.1 hypothetical protein [Rhizobium sp. BK347]
MRRDFPAGLRYRFVLSLFWTEKEQTDITSAGSEAARVTADGFGIVQGATVKP